MAFDMSSAVPVNAGKFDMASAVPVARGDDSGPAYAEAEGVSNVVPAGQKITSAIGAGWAKLHGVDGSLPDLYNQAQANTEATAKAHPIAAGVGTGIGVGFAGPILGAAGKAAGAVADAFTPRAVTGALSGLGETASDAGILSKGAGLATRSAVSGAKGASGAYPVGALYGAANAPWDSGDSVLHAANEGGKTTAEIGGAIGSGLEVAGSALGAGADAVGAARSYLNKDTVSEQTKAGKIETAVPAANSIAMGKVVKRFNADFPDPAQRQAALDKYLATNDVGLAEAAGKNTKNLALGAAQYPSGEAGAQDYFATRTSGAPARIAKTFADQVSSNNDYFGTLDGITEKGRQVAKPLYDTAFGGNKAVSSPEIDEVLKTPAGKQALGAARNKMLNDRSVMSSLSDKDVGEMAQEATKLDQMYNSSESAYSRPDMTGSAPPVPKFNLRTLDYVKRGLDDQIGAAVRAGEKDNVRILSGLKNSFVKALDDADETGAYAQARSKAGDYLRNSDAMDAGRDFMKPGTAGQPEQIAKNFNALGDTEKEAYKAGMVRAVKEAMDKPSADQPDFYKKVFGSPDMQNRVKAVLNPSEFDVLSKNLKAEQDLYKFKNETLGNSRTAVKQISAEEFNGEGQRFAQDVINQGPKQAVIKRGVQWVSSMFDGLSNKTAGQVSKILYETDPAKKLQILNAIKNDNGIDAGEKQTAIKAYFSVNGLFKNMAKIQGTVNNGDENGQ